MIVGGLRSPNPVSFTGNPGKVPFADMAAQFAMPDLSQLEGILRFGFSASLAHGFGHMGHFHAGGVAFVGKLLMLALGVVVVFVLAAMAAPLMGDWIRKHVDLPDYTGTAGWGAFLIIGFLVLLAFIFALARML